MGNAAEKGAGGLRDGIEAARVASVAPMQAGVTGESGAALQGLTVLLVEDSWHIAVAVKSLLESVGVAVEGPAGSLARALALLEHRAPDVAVVDINLKGEMSFGLIDRLVGMGIPVVVVSGYNEAERLDGKAVATLSKPVRASALLAALARAAEVRRRHP